MDRRVHRLISLWIMTIGLLFPIPSRVSAQYIQFPIPGNELSSPDSLDPGLQNFVHRVFTGESDTLAGVYVSGLMALPVVQQPQGDATFVSDENNLLTQFGMAEKVGSVGLLAHNTLSGALFFDLDIGEQINLVYGDGQLRNFEVESIQRFEALAPSSPFSDFIPLDTKKEQLTSAQLFYKVYMADEQVVFQTCIARDGNPSWGRLFVTARPVQTKPLPVLAFHTSSIRH